MPMMVDYAPTLLALKGYKPLVTTMVMLLGEAAPNDGLLSGWYWYASTDTQVPNDNSIVASDYGGNWLKSS